MLNPAGPYDDALVRFHLTGPEFEGYLSNHGPMVVEVLARRGQADRIDAWTDRYVRRLDELPRRRWPISAQTWREALGQPDRAADWIGYLLGELGEDPWRAVLARWWPRLLPGIAGGATHGVIRVGHAVQALTEVESAARITELGHALGYWAARWQPITFSTPAGTRSPGEVLSSLPRIARQHGAAGERLSQLDSTVGWIQQAATLRSPDAADDVPSAIAAVTDAAVSLYPLYASANPTMLVHAVTAPNAVAMTLPQLPPALWRASLTAAWSASAAVLAAYAPARARNAGPTSAAATDPRGSDPPADDVLARALAHGGEHVLKFADAALASYVRTGAAGALRAAVTAVELDA